MVPNVAAVVEVTGEVDYERLDPILVEKSGRRWRLKAGEAFLVGDRVRLSATRQDFDTLLVRAVSWEQWGPRLHCD